MSIFAHAGHSHGIDAGLIAFVIVALVLGSAAAMAALRAWQERDDSDHEGEMHDSADRR